VVLKPGYFFGLLGRDNVTVLHDLDVTVPVIETDTITAFALARDEIKVGQTLQDGVLRTSDQAACRAWAKHSDLLR
jgi:hypothetical protein